MLNKKSESERRCEEMFIESQKIEKEIEDLRKKYQDEPDILARDYDDVITKSLIGFIANFNITSALRDDIITQIDVLIRNREFVISHYSNNSSSDNNK